MTAAVVWSVLMIVGSALYLAGEVNGRRAERKLGRHRVGRRNSYDAFEALTLTAANDDLSDNDRWSRKAAHLEVVR